MFASGVRRFQHKASTILLMLSMFALQPLQAAPKPSVPTLVDTTAPTVSKPTSCLKVTQRSKLNGDEIILLSQSGIRIENPRSHIILFAKPPEWTIYKLSQETKKYTVTPLAAFNNPLVQAQVFAKGINLSKATCVKTGTERLFDQPADLYKSDAAFEKNSIDLYMKAKMVTESYPKSFTFKTFARETFPAQEARILSILHG